MVYKKPVTSISQCTSTSEGATIIVHGTPVSQGSMNTARGRVYHRGQKGLEQWRQAINRACPTPPVFPKRVPVRVSVTFFLPRPTKTDFTYPVGKDLDKLQRAVGDALTADKPTVKLVPKKLRRGVFQDDTQIVRWEAVKTYATPDCPCPAGGAVINVTAV